VAKSVDHVQQSRKKRITKSTSAITSFFGATNPYKKIDEQQQQFWKIWSSIFAGL
jgi:hypothetical protein